MRKGQQGFTLVELIVTVCVVAILASLATREMRDYVRRSHVSEVLLALSKCRNTVTENYLSFDAAPLPGTWGCEQASGSTSKVGAIQSSTDGVVRSGISNVDALLNGHYVYLAPARADGVTPMTAPNDLGKGVQRWICGSDWQPVRNALPSSCRSDTTTFASQDFR